MNEEQLVNKIKQLKTITPESDWVLANKKELLGEERTLDWSLFVKPALVGASAFAIFLAFNLSEDALPGEILFTFKKISEQKDAIMSLEEERPIHSLELANKRLEDLYLITERNEIDKISPALNEFQDEIEEATKEISKVVVTDKKINEDFFVKAEKLKETKKKVEKVLASELGGEKYDEYEIWIARAKIKDAEDYIEQLRLVDLSEEDNQKLDEMKLDLEKAKGYLSEEKYNSAYQIIDEVYSEISNMSKEKLNK